MAPATRRPGSPGRSRAHGARPKTSRAWQRSTSPRVTRTLPGRCSAPHQATGSAGGYYSDIPHVYNDPFVVSEP